ncbi:hypothetical protein OG937_10925 [Streptomyces sp. NBC_00510]
MSQADPSSVSPQGLELKGSVAGQEQPQLLEEGGEHVGFRPAEVAGLEIVPEDDVQWHNSVRLAQRQQMRGHGRLALCGALTVPPAIPLSLREGRCLSRLLVQRRFVLRIQQDGESRWRTCEVTLSRLESFGHVKNPYVTESSATQGFSHARGGFATLLVGRGIRIHDQPESAGWGESGPRG